MTCVPAPACRIALAEATQIAPRRSKASDGICARPEHTAANPTSDHETGDAFDLTHDPDNGCDVDALFDQIIARRDPRVKYLIWQRKILRSYDKPGIPAWTWTTYTGSNPHVKHGHVSILPGTRNISATWFTRHDTDPISPQLPPLKKADNDMEIINPVDDQGAADEFAYYLRVGTTYRTIKPDELPQLREAGYPERSVKPAAWALIRSMVTEGDPRA